MKASTTTHKRTARSGFAAAAALVALGLGTVLAGAQDAPKAVAASAPAKPASQVPDPATPTYLRDVLPIFMGKCARCHNDQTRFLYNWLDYKTAFADRGQIKRRVWDSWKGEYYKQSMPVGNSPECEAMTPEERTTIKDWVADGAVYGVAPTASSPKSKAEQIELGGRLFASICALCHQPTGQGLPGQFPPLARSDFLNANKDTAIKILLHGRQGAITVNGQTFDGSMPSLPLGDSDIANALTYVYNSFGNSGKEVTPDEVRNLRAQKEDDTPAPRAQKEVAKAPSRPNPYE